MIDWKFRGYGNIEPAVLIAETGEVVDFVRYRNVCESGAIWIGARATSEICDYNGPYRVAFNIQEAIWVAYARERVT